MIKIPNLDIHPSNFCNLHCEQCSHLSNYNIKEIFNECDIEIWYKSWYKKLNPEYFSISGGEPLTNPKIKEILILTKKYWPASKLRFFTNGLLSEKSEEVFKLLKLLNFEIYVSNHSSKNSLEYDKKFNDALQILKKYSKKYNLKITIQYSNFESKIFEGLLSYEDSAFFQKNKPPSWIRWYKNYGVDMEPYNDNNIEQSFENCVAPCPQLFKNQIYKCPPLAYLPELNKKIKLSSKWEHYLSYKPLSPKCTLEEINNFFYKTLNPESFCNMCPSTPQYFTPLHNPLKFIPIHKKIK